jgi:hypothetical protein
MFCLDNLAFFVAELNQNFNENKFMNKSETSKLSIAMLYIES